MNDLAEMPRAAWFVFGFSVAMILMLGVLLWEMDEKRELMRKERELAWNEGYDAARAHHTKRAALEVVRHVSTAMEEQW